MEEVHDSIGYARSQGWCRELEVVYVTGGGGGMKAVAAMKSAVSAPVSFWNPLDHIGRDERSPEVDESAGPLLGVAIGLALRRPS